MPEEAERLARLCRPGRIPFQLTRRWTSTRSSKPTQASPHSTATERSPRRRHCRSDLPFKLPPGLLGNVRTRIAQCTDTEFSTISLGNFNLCPADSAIGVASVRDHRPEQLFGFKTLAGPVFNIVPGARATGTLRL